MTIDEGKQICKVVKDTGKILHIGTQQRSANKAMFLKAVVMAQSGRLGKKLTATCSIGGGPSGGPFPTTDPPANLDWDFWLGQAPKVPYTKERCHGNFRWWLEYSGGKMTDWGAHHVDIAQWGLGHDHSGPVEIEGLEAEISTLRGDVAARDLVIDNRKLNMALAGLLPLVCGLAAAVYVVKAKEEYQSLFLWLDFTVKVVCVAGCVGLMSLLVSRESWLNRALRWLSPYSFSLRY